jgi:transitional endoplasmic reticulum ATPase
MGEEVNLRVAKSYQNDFGRGIVRMDPDSLLRLQLSPGEIVELEGKRKTAAKVWRADRQDWGMEYIRMDGFTRQNAGISIGELVKIRKADVKRARKVILSPSEGLCEVDMEWVEQSLRRCVIVAGDIVPIKDHLGGTVFVQATKTNPEGIALIDEGTIIELEGFVKRSVVGLAYEDIGGLSNEIQRVREMIELPFKHPEVFRRLGIEAPKGILLSGPPGTGKTLIARVVANESGAEFFYIAGPEIMSKYYGESEKRLREIFEEAKEKAPSIVFIDELDSIALKREDVTGELERRVVAQLLSLMDGLEERGEIVVIGATNRIDAIDPALRRPGRFDREIELPVPREEERVEILHVHTRNMPLKGVNLEELAGKTHGFVGADIASLCKEAAMKALRRHFPELNMDKKIPEHALEDMTVTDEDFREALKEMEPSAMREVLIEVPRVEWDDVGGLGDVKREVREVVELPLKYPEKFKRMGIRPPKGVLLLGPPGTGKTLIAKAVASETDANFIPVDGPQLLSKWVGESEKAVREIFKKARQVSPSIIFLDELDAIASARGLREGAEMVVNQLLAELDGITHRNDVVVIGATNRPDMIDHALIRHGRFDRLVLVGTPDRDGRREIFKIHTRNMSLEEENFNELADMTEGYAGSDIEAICIEAMMIALRENEDVVRLRHLKEALKKVKPSLTEDTMDNYYRFMETFESKKSYMGYR